MIAIIAILIALLPQLAPLSVRRRWRIVVLGIVICGGIAAWWRVNAPPLRQNLLLVTLDTTRADRLGPWNGPARLTPHLDELASAAVVFERAYAPVPLTLPSHASLMTGLYPPEHGLRVNSGLNRLADGVPVLADVLRERGYRTGAFVGSFVLDRKFGLDRGFDVYDDLMEEAHGPTPGDAHGHKMRIGERVVDAALNWLGRQRGKPFACWVHLFDPHTPYSSREELFGERFRERPYDAGIAYVDRQVGRLKDYLEQHRLDRSTLIVVLGDHGESLGEHGERSHGFTLYNATLQVPLIIRRPGNQSPARRIATPVSIVDLYPTLVEELAPGVKLECSGRSLLPACRGEDLPNLTLYAESNHPFEEAGAAPLRSLISNRWKYVRSPRPELYDLLSDPGEERNLAAEQAAEMEWLETQLKDLESAFRVREVAAVVASPHELRTLASLGYAGGGATPGIDESRWPDVKDVLPHYNAYADAQQLLSEGRFADTAEILDGVVHAVPNFFQAWYNLGVCRQQLQDLSGAESAFQRAVDIDGNASALIALGGVCLAQQQPDRAIPHLESAVRLQPDLARGHFLLAEAYRLVRRIDDARQEYQEALAADPEFLPARQMLDSLPDGER